MKRLLLILLFVPILSFGEDIYLECMVSGKKISTLKEQILKLEKVTVEINQNEGNISIFVVGSEDFFDSVTTRKDPAKDFLNYSNNDKFDIHNFITYSSTHSRWIHFQINRLTGLISVNSKYFSNNPLLETSYQGECKKSTVRKF